MPEGLGIFLGQAVDARAEPMQQENSRIPPESIQFVTEMERFRPGSN